jgi:hypothetical protein
MKRYLPVALLIASLAALAFGIVELFELRFEAGDVYPVYSSLRADPLGTMALYESLQGLPEFSVQRDFSTDNRLPFATGTTYFHIAGNHNQWQQPSGAMLREIEQFASSGGRLVITLYPQPANSFQPGRLREPQQPPETEGRDRWGVNFQIVDLRRRADGVYDPDFAKNETDLALPAMLKWQTGLVFANLNPAWKPIYARGGAAVVIERQYGRGSVVIATDSFFVSNEAMLRARQAGLLAWLVGSNRNVVFDEAHFGLTESPGVATLIRKYGLTWFVAGLILLAGLFIWMNSMSLVPFHAQGQSENYVSGKAAAAGFDNLLRRSIPARDLLATCFNEWKKSVIRTGKYSIARIQRVEAVFQDENSLAERNRDPVKAYQTISAILRTGTK